MNYRTLITTAFAAGILFAIAADAEDQGAAIAVAAQDGPSAVSLNPQEQFVSAQQKVEEVLEKLGVEPGYDPEKKTIVVVTKARLTSKNPAGDDSFMVKRSAKALEAYLNAKAEIIRTFAMEFSAIDQISAQDEFAQTKEEVELAGKIDEAQNKLADFAAKAGKPELADAELNADLVSTLRGLDLPAPQPTTTQTATAKNVEVKTAEGDEGKADEVTVETKTEPAPGTDLGAMRDALIADIQSIIKAADAIPRKAVNESTSKTELMSKMPLLGAQVLRQAESWDRTEGTYEIAMAVLWSPKLQEEAKNLAAGTPVPSEKKGKFSAREWVKQQDLLAMAGPRRFIDKNGNTILVGIASRDIAGMPTTKVGLEEKKAQTEAMRYVATSLMCDLETFRTVTQNFAEYEDGSAEAEEHLRETIASKTSLNISGVTKLGEKEGFHGITGRKTYAVAYYMDASLNKDAMERIKQLYADAITVTDANNFKRGQLAGADAKYEEAKASTEKFEEGKAEAAADVAGRVRAAEVKAKVTGPQGSSGANKVGEKGGVLDGESLDTVDLDF